MKLKLLPLQPNPWVSQIIAQAARSFIMTWKSMVELIMNAAKLQRHL
jgi:hypothetical protein